MESIYLIGMIVQSLVFVTLWTLLHQYITIHGPISQARKFTQVNSTIYSAVSLFLMLLIVASPAQGLARHLYHISKFWEYIDILGVCAAGSSIDLHFGFHHLTTPWYTFFRVLQHHEGWWAFAAANTGHHVLMYAFFGGATGLRPVLDMTGFLQLLIGIATDLQLIRHKMVRSDGPLWPNILGATLLSTYLMLWMREMGMRKVT